MKTKFVVFPGASLMDIRQYGDSLVITCPGCHEVLRLSGAQLGDVDFTHGDNCPINALIQAALLAVAPTLGVQ